MKMLLSRLLRGEDLSEDEAGGLMAALAEGAVSPALAGGLLVEGAADEYWEISVILLEEILNYVALLNPRPRILRLALQTRLAKDELAILL